MDRKTTFGSVIDELRNSYRTVDIRTAVARETIRDEWQCIFAKIRLTKEELQNVKITHSGIKNRLRSRDNTKFRLLAECKDVSEFDSIINEIQSHQLVVEGLF